VYVGLFGACVGLFGVYVGIFGIYAGLFVVYVGLFGVYVGFSLQSVIALIEEVLESMADVAGM